MAEEIQRKKPAAIFICVKVGHPPNNQKLESAKSAVNESKSGLLNYSVESGNSQGILHEQSDSLPREESLISPSENDSYHEKMLSLLQITNNQMLNNWYYQVVPQIAKSSLLAFDPSLSPTVCTF